jgi:hypothetical protein
MRSFGDSIPYRSGLLGNLGVKWDKNMENLRQLTKNLKIHFKKYKQALILLGPRQVGKTTILKKLFPNAKYLLVDEAPIKDALETYSSIVYKQIIGPAKQIIIDEIHLITDPGRAVKILYDQFEGLQIIVTGSSSLHIKNKTAESMAGRSIYYYMHPLTYSEYLVQSGIEAKLNNKVLEKIINLDISENAKIYNQKSILEQVIIFGQYPSIINNPRDQIYLNNLANAAVFKDIVELNLIDNRAKALELLKALAYQIGNLISYAELANRIKIDAKTVQRYIEIFEQSYILYRIYPFSTSKRKEIGKSPKIYFWDTGLRNALIDNFDQLAIRSDAGALFENFIISEVKKIISYNNFNWKTNYWRLKSGPEVDLILSNNRKLIGCEIKLTGGNITQAFLNKYPETETHLISSSNFY